MAITLAEAANRSNDVVVQGIIETIIKESPLLAMIPWDMDVVGTAATYVRELAMATAGRHEVGGTWTESTPTTEQKTVALKVYGLDADVDSFLARTRSNINDLEGDVIEGAAKALAHLVEEDGIYGDPDSDSKMIDGLHEFCEDGPATQTIAQGTTTTPDGLALEFLDKVIDAVRPGKPDFLITTRAVRNKMSSYARALTSPITYEPNEFGHRVMFYDGIPLFTSDFMKDTEVITNGGLEVTAATGGASSSLFAVKVGQDGLHGLSNGGVIIEPVGALETKDARRHRIKWYLNFALGGQLSIARLGGIDSAQAVAELNT